MKPKKLSKKLVLNKVSISNMDNIVGGVDGTGNCLSFIHITCPEPCDFQSIPLDECKGNDSIFVCTVIGCPETVEEC